MALRRPSRKRQQGRTASIKKKFEEPAPRSRSSSWLALGMAGATQNCFQCCFSSGGAALSGRTTQRNSLRNSSRYLLRVTAFSGPRSRVQRSRQVVSHAVTCLFSVSLLFAQE